MTIEVGKVEPEVIRQAFADRLASNISSTETVLQMLAREFGISVGEVQEIVIAGKPQVKRGLHLVKS